MTEPWTEYGFSSAINYHIASPSLKLFFVQYGYTFSKSIVEYNEPVYYGCFNKPKVWQVFFKKDGAKTKTPWEEVIEEIRLH